MIITSQKNVKMIALAINLDTPIEHQAAPEIFCLNLYPDFGIDRLVAIGAPARISNRYPAKIRQGNTNLEYRNYARQN